MLGLYVADQGLKALDITGPEGLLRLTVVPGLTSYGTEEMLMALEYKTVH